MSYVIGLTGLIGSGKSLVANYFASYGAGVIDTDKIAHEVTAIGSPVLDLLAKKFGQEFINSEGKLDRVKLRQVVFEDQIARLELEQIIHPVIFERVLIQIKQAFAPYIILVVPLLFKAPKYLDLIERSLFIDAHEHLIFERVMCRSKLTYEEIFKILNSQMPRDQQISLADDIIINNANEAELNKQVMKLDLKYKQLALK